MGMSFQLSLFNRMKNIPPAVFQEYSRQE